jgi:hypothetical protein
MNRVEERGWERGQEMKGAVGTGSEANRRKAPWPDGRGVAQREREIDR